MNKGIMSSTAAQSALQARSGKAYNSLKQAIADCSSKTTTTKKLTIEVCGPESNKDLYVNLFPFLFNATVVYQGRDQYLQPYKQSTVDIVIQDQPVDTLKSQDLDVWHHQCQFKGKCHINRIGEDSYTINYSPSSPVLGSYEPKSPTYSSRFPTDYVI